MPYVSTLKRHLSAAEARCMQTSASLRAAIASHRMYWRSFSAKHAFLPSLENQAENVLRQAPEGDWWFSWYMQRMHTRWLVRLHPNRVFIVL